MPKDFEPRCAYCKWAAPLEAGKLICEKKGIVTETERCFRFRYDPLKRVPPRPSAPDFSRFEGEDFSL